MKIDLGNIDREIDIEYKGKIFSLNDLYKQGHWSNRKNIKDKYKEIFLTLLYQLKPKPFEQFYLLVTYNTRHDVDNLVGPSKVFVDTLKGLLVENDGKKYYKGLMIFEDSTLPFNTVHLNILPFDGTKNSWRITR